MSHCKKSSQSRTSGGSKMENIPKDTFVYVRRLIEKRIKVPVVSSDRVKDLKAKIEKLEGIAVGNQTLDFGGIPLVDENAKLSQYGIKNEDNLHVMEKTCSRGWIQLFVKSPTETFSIGICAQSTAMNLKKKIEEKIGLETGQQRLVFQGKLLPDNLVLASSEVKQSSTVMLYLVRLTKINVCTLSGSSHSIEVEDVDTVLALKEKIFKEFHVPPSGQNLIGFGDKQLDNKKMMIDYGIKENSVIWLIPKREEAGESITVFVMNSSKKGIRVETGSHSTVLAFKKKIQEIEGTSSDKQRLFVEDMEAMDSMCLTDAGIVDGAVVQLRIRRPLTLRVSRRDNIERDREVVVDVNDRISDLRTLIANEFYIGDEKTEITYKRAALKNERTIASYDIPNKGRIIAEYAVGEC